ncbi:MAG: hypothetical protein ACREBI_02480 [Nitrosotalea sp.]
MPNIRCDSFNDLLWAYVTDIAKIRKISRCKALATVIEEHMKFMALAQQKKGRKVGEKKKERR